MAPLDLLGHVEATESGPGLFVVTARGPMDGRVAGELRDLLVPVAAADGAFVVLDLIDAHCVDDEAVAVISVAAHLALDRGSRLRVVTVSRTIEELLRDRGLGRLLTIEASRSQAPARD